MNNLWIGMILLGIVYGAVTGNMQAVTDAAFASAKDAVTLCITMTGMMALWVGVMEIARGAGLIRKWSEKLGSSAIIRFSSFSMSRYIV